jgi:hypothetical protein
MITPHSTPATISHVSDLSLLLPDYMPRSGWEEPGYRMAIDFTRLPTPFRPRTTTRLVAHYGGAINLPDGDTPAYPERQQDIPPLLRAIQRDYLINRTGGGYTRRSDGKYFPGYHIGYSWAVDWLGKGYELRGSSFLPAATNDHNDYTAAILFITDGDAPATAAAWQTARIIGRYVRDLHLASVPPPTSPFNPQFTDHGRLFLETGIGTPTACSGKGIRAQTYTPIANLDLHTDPPKPPIPGDIAMRILILNDAGTPTARPAVLLTGHIATWLDPGRYTAYHAVYPIQDEQAAKSWLINTVFTGPLPPGVTKADVWQHVPPIS